jgi:hypothetical protein
MDLKFEVAFNTNPGTEPGTWTDLSDRIRSRGTPVDVSLGAGRLTGGGEGSCELTLDNRDRAIDPTNGSAPYNLVPMRHARLSVTVNSTSYPLFRGFVDAWPPSWLPTVPGESNVRVRLVDGFAWLALQDADIDLPRQFTHERVDALLDLAGWPADRRDIDPGRIRVEPVEQQSGNLLRWMQDTVDAERGDLWVAPDGKITFRGRHDRFDGTPAVTFGTGGQPISGGEPAWDGAWLTNVGRVELANGQVFEFYDEASGDAYGPRFLSDRDLALRPVEAKAVAEWEVIRFSQPRLWIDQLLTHGTRPGVLEAVLPLRVGDLARVVVTHAVGDPLDEELSIERIQHTIGDAQWETVVDLSPYHGEGPWFTWDDATRGWDMDAKWAP